MPRKIIDYRGMVGQRFGRITIMDLSAKAKGERQFLICDCDCGTTGKSINGKDIYHGKINSCGCASWSKNTYEFKDNYLSLIIMDTEMINHEVYIDKEDYDLVRQHHWNYRHDGYITSGDFNKSNIYLHRLIMNATSKNDMIDHINRNPSDNRKHNLRRANPIENGINKNLDSRNKTGVTGVYQQNRKKKPSFLAYIQINKKMVKLGKFEQIEDAIKARQEAELKYYGDFSPLNSEKVIQENINKLKQQNNT